MDINQITKTKNPYFENVSDISANEVQDKLTSFNLIDVREPHEFNNELGHIKNAVLLPLGEISQNPQVVLTHPEIQKDKPMLFICRSGMRSAQASYLVNNLKENTGFNLLGGMITWNQLLLPVEKN